MKCRPNTVHGIHVVTLPSAFCLCLAAALPSPTAAGAIPVVPTMAAIYEVPAASPAQDAATSSEQPVTASDASDTLTDTNAQVAQAFSEETPTPSVETPPPIVETPIVETPPAPEAPTTPLITNVFFDTYITEALNNVAFQAGVNIIADTTVQGFVSLDLVDVPLEEALTMILAPGGYTYKKINDNTYLVGLAEPGSPMFHLLSETERYHFRYIDAESGERLTPTEYQKYVKFDSETNAAVVTAAPDVLNRILADLRTIDAAPEQVMIDVVVTEVATDGKRSLGVDWSWSRSNAGPFADPDPNFLAFSGVVGSIGYVSQSGLEQFLATLNILVDEGKAEIRANPRVAVLDGEEANIFVGKQRYYEIVTGSNENPYTRLQSIDAGVALKVIPQVAANGDITLYIEPDISDVNETSNLPEVSRRNVSTTVRVKDGQTVAIGGLLQSTESKIITKVPILGDLPLLVHLFRHTSTVEQETEVMVFITPRLLGDEMNATSEEEDN